MERNPLILCRTGLTFFTGRICGYLASRSMRSWSKTFTFDFTMAEEGGSNVCSGCRWTYNTFRDMIKDEDRLLNFLYDHQIIPKSKVCEKCSFPMCLRDGMFRCNKRSFVCKNKKHVSVKCGYQVSQNR